MSNFINEKDKRFYAAASSGAAVESFPSQDFYRTMRHRELTAYRMVVQCLLMHNNDNTNSEDAAQSQQKQQEPLPVSFAQLTRAQQRLLEDLEAELVVPPSRRDAEIEDAGNDAAVTAVRTSGVACRRPVHFDGIKDLPLFGGNANNNDDENDTDDDGAIIAVGQHQKSSGARRGRAGEANGSSNNNNNGNNAGPSKPALSAKVSKPLDGATAAQLAKLTKQIPDLCKELVECFGPEDAARKTQIEISLRKMQNEISKIREKAAANCANQG